VGRRAERELCMDSNYVSEAIGSRRGMQKGKSRKKKCAKSGKIGKGNKQKQGQYHRFRQAVKQKNTPINGESGGREGERADASRQFRSKRRKKQ